MAHLKSLKYKISTDPNFPYKLGHIRISGYFSESDVQKYRHILEDFDDHVSIDIVPDYLIDKYIFIQEITRFETTFPHDGKLSNGYFHIYNVGPEEYDAKKLRIKSACDHSICVIMCKPKCYYEGNVVQPIQTLWEHVDLCCKIKSIIGKKYGPATIVPIILGIMKWTQTCSDVKLHIVDTPMAREYLNYILHMNDESIIDENMRRLCDFS
jgi:hypothetical protein